MGPRIQYLYTLFDEFNKAEFDNKLLTIPILIQRNNRIDGYYEYKHHHKTQTPVRDRLGSAEIVISEHCFEDDDLVQGTLLHEMIHQYQAEILDMPTDHGRIFNEIACRS
jgi:hypothetical protein